MPNITSAFLQRNLKRLARMKSGMVRGLLRTLKKIDQEKAKRVEDLEEAAVVIRRELAELGHKFTNTSDGRRAKAKTAKTAKKGKRVRRSPEQLKAEATKVLSLIRSAGKDGMSGGDIRKKFPGVGQNIKGFVQQYTGEKLKTTGQKVKMRYHHA